MFLFQLRFIVCINNPFANLNRFKRSCLCTGLRWFHHHLELSRGASTLHPSFKQFCLRLYICFTTPIYVTIKWSTVVVFWYLTKHYDTMFVIHAPIPADGWLLRVYKKVTVLSHWLLYTTEHLFCRLWQWRWCKTVISSQVLDRGGFVGCHCHKVVVVVIKRWTVLSYHCNIIYIYWQPCVCSAACRLACSGGVYISALYLCLVISSVLDATLVRASVVVLCSHACWLSSSSLLSCCRRCSWERSCCCWHDAALRKCIHEWANLLRCLQVLWWDGWTPHASICHHAHLGNVLEKLFFSNYNFIIL